VLSSAPVILPSCRRPDAGASLVAPDVASCLPPSASSVAGLDLDRLRASTLWPAFAPQFGQAFDHASALVLAFEGPAYLVIESGRFSSAPPGTTLAASGLALLGAPPLVQSALARARASAPSAPLPLLADAAPDCRGKPLWAVVRGAAALPLSGNLENLNRLFRPTAFVTLSADLSPAIRLSLAGHCNSPEAAQRFEETVRALVSLSRAARGPALPALDFHRDGLVVRVSAAADSAAAAALTRELLR